MNVIQIIFLNLIAMALCLGLIGFIEAASEEEYIEDLKIKWGQLQSNQNQLYATINDVFDECDDTALILFQSNLNLNSMKKSDYCTMNCVLRKMDVMMDGGADANKYLRIVKTLLLNYTERAFADESEKTTYNNAVKLFDVSYEFVKVYEFAASRCRQILRRHEDGCDASFRFVRCILARGRTKYYSMPMFPLVPPRDTSLLTQSTGTP